MSAHLVIEAVIDEFSLNDFTDKERIGNGSEGEVFRGYNDRLGKVAYKRLNRLVNKTDMSEVILLAKHSNHPNIIRLFGLLTPEEGYSPNNRSFYIGYVMECMERSLFDVIHNTSVEYDMEQVYSWIEKASSGLQYLHEKGIMHRDIKPQNILLGKSLDDLRISDFGLAKVVETQTASHTYEIGTINYMAPELHDENKYDKSADIYALTITFWEIIHREKPYGYMGVIPQYKQIIRILNGDRPNIHSQELEISALLIRGWDSNPKSRPKISEFIEFSRKKMPAQENLIKVVSQQNVNQNENKVEKESEKQQNTSVLILGSNRYLNTIYLLDSKAQSWKKLSITLPVGRYGFGAVILNEEIYIFGGNANWNPQQDCYKLKDNGSWIQLASMNQKRNYISSSSLVYKGDIWAIGGYSGVEYLNSVEKYDISQSKWTYMLDMNYARFKAAAAVFKDRIVVTGGRNKKNLKSVEIFDPLVQKWILFCDLPIEVYSHTMLISNSTLSIFGGCLESDQLNSVWKMDIEDPEKKWTQKQSFKHPRSSFGIGKLSNGIIVFGGFGRIGKTSEIFDGNKWVDGSKLPQKLSDFAYISIPRSLEKSFLKKFTFEGFLAQSVTQNENKVEKQGGGQQSTSVLILGGFYILNTIYLLDLKAQRWKELKIILPMGIREFGAVVLNEEIYIFGGSANWNPQQDCYKLKNDRSWIKLASLNQKRTSISSSSLVYKGDIWVIGGYYAGYSALREFYGDYLKSVERYDISQNKWTYMPEMNYARWDAAAAVFKDRIFVTGGPNWKMLKSVEMFDPILQKWNLFCDLPIEVAGHTMLISNSTLSIFGGYSESRKLNSVWEMDIEDPEKKWTEKQSFKCPRDYFGIGKLSNGIIVFGGRGNADETSEIFDGNGWIDGPKLPQNLSHFAYISIPRSLEESFLKKFS